MFSFCTTFCPSRLLAGGSIGLFLLCLIPLQEAVAQHHHANAEVAYQPTEEDYYHMSKVPIPQGVVLEVGGMALLPNGSLGVSTRRGEVWIIDNPYRNGGEQPYFRRFATGMHEALGLAYRNDTFYVAQRAELTRLIDKNKDGKADTYQSMGSWPLSGNYCEYNHGPVILPDGSFWINMNLADNGWFTRDAFTGEMGSLARWRGWTMKVTPKGELVPIASGMRSPAGLGLNAEGEMFYTENQGGWVPSGYLTHVENGDFFGHPAGLKWADLPGSSVKTRRANIPTTAESFAQAIKKIPGFKAPAVWLPHGILGTSTSEPIADQTAGAFGPFAGQLFVGDQGQGKIIRVFLEKVKGKYQGASFPFREGFASGVLRLAWGSDGSLFAGMSDRGWNSSGPDRYGIQRLVWSGEMPFEIKAIRAKSDGFELEFTMPVNTQQAQDLTAYKITGFSYLYHKEYGSPVVDKQDCPVRAVVLSEDGLTVRLVGDGLREGYIHEIRSDNLHAATGLPLLHSFGYYTLNNLPEGEKLALPKKLPPTSPQQQQLVQQHGNSKGQSQIVPMDRKVNAWPKHLTTQPASWTNGPEKTVTIGTKPGLKYDLDEFTVKVGSTVKLVFTNNDDMQHNVVVVRPGEITQVGQMALNLGLDGAAMDYIPKTDKVLYHTSLLQPSTKEAIYFTAPTQPGNYPYICTYPGHYTIMQGIMKVVK